MTTNNNSWSLGTTPNKSLDLSRRSLLAKVDQFGPSIPIHLPGDRRANRQQKNCVLSTRPFAAPTRPTRPTSSLGHAWIIDSLVGHWTLVLGHFPEPPALSALTKFS